MSAYAILRQSHSSPESFDAAREALVQAHHLEEGDASIPVWVALSAGADHRDSFDRAAAFLTRALEGQDHLTVLVDEVDASKLNPLRDNGWSSLLAMLILAFPEVRWVYLVVTRKAGDEAAWETIFDCHGVGRLTEDRGSPLFDGHGLRQVVIERMAEDDRKWREEREQQGEQNIPSEVAGIPQRPKLAVVLDEETSYSHFEAFMAYKNGFRAHAIASWSEAESLLGPNGILSLQEGVPESDAHTSFELSLEDWYLNFPDQAAQRMSDLDQRSRVLPALSLDGTLRRRFVTIGHERKRQDEQNRKSRLRDLRAREYVVQARRVKRSRQVLCKPISGFYSVWSKLGLDRAYPKGVPGFVWPPVVQDRSEESNDGHSSPGRLLEIAEHLLQRCSVLVDNANTVTEAVRGAVLATQAQELLAGKTPTCSLEALALKHKFEVLAECHFIGVQHNIEVKQRMKEIERDVRFIANRFQKRHKRASELDAEVAIFSKLVSTFRDYNQFDEEMECLYWERKAMAKLFSSRSGIAGWGKCALWTYLNWLLRRPVWFLFWILAWLIAGALTYGLIAASPTLWSWGSFGKSLGWAIDAFVAGDFDECKWLGRILAASGLFHFGVFISYIYTLIIRK